jgi:hypothetical protein
MNTINAGVQCRVNTRDRSLQKDRCIMTDAMNNPASGT